MKFRISPKFGMGRGANLGKCQTNAKPKGFFYIFRDILYKRKSNLGQECVERGPLNFQVKIGTTALISLEN